MDCLANLSLISSLLLTFLALFRWYKITVKLPPGPFPFPIIGNILQLGPNPHQSAAKLATTYVPLMHLKLGSIHTVVASSPEIAKLFLQKHDKISCGRFVPHAAQTMDHHKASIAWLPAGRKWRNFRKLCKEHMFTVHKLEASEGLRREKLEQLRGYLHECCTSQRLANIGEVAFTTSLNLVSATLVSLDFAQFNSNSAQEIKEIVQSTMKIMGTPNLADYFPFLQFIDPQGLKRDSDVYAGKLFAIFDDIIDRRLESRRKSKEYARKDDLLEVLLDLNQESASDLSRNDINHLLIELMVAGVDTASDSVHWAVTELLRNPGKLAKLKDELRTVIGVDDKQVRESDISRLPYLNAVIKESFRLHPAAPFLIPRKAEDDIEVDGYTIPKGAHILVNVWAMGRDSKIWSNPDWFEPERFLDSKVDYRGQHFELITFGSGRRMCPGLPLAHVMVHLMVACFVHNFDWKLENGMKPEDVDLKETFGFSLRKNVSLKAFPTKHI